MNRQQALQISEITFLDKNKLNLLLQHTMQPGYVKESHHKNNCILMTGKAVHGMSLLQTARNKHFKMVSCIFCSRQGFATSIKLSS